jgi:hypothetical protein
MAHPTVSGVRGESTPALNSSGFRGTRPGLWKPLSADDVRTAFAETRSLPAFYERVISAYAEYHDARRFVDKVWPTYGRLALARWQFPSALFVNLVRDGRDAYCRAPDAPHADPAGGFGRWAMRWPVIFA